LQLGLQLLLLLVVVDLLKFLVKLKICDLLVLLLQHQVVLRLKLRNQGFLFLVKLQLKLACGLGKLLLRHSFESTFVVG